MKKPTIPDGWRQIRIGSIIKDGDKFWNEASKDWWHSTSEGYKIGRFWYRTREQRIYIRKINP